MEQHGLLRLRCANASDVATLDIPASSRNFLLYVGLPDDEILGLRFDFLGSHLPTLEELATRVGFDSSPPNGSRPCLGLTYDVAVCIDEQRDGAVYCVDLAQEEPERLLNSRVEWLGAFLAMYVSHCRVTSGAPDPEIDRAVLELEHQMCEIDPVALSDTENWWPLILEQMKHGII